MTATLRHRADAGASASPTLAAADAPEHPAGRRFNGGLFLAEEGGDAQIGARLTVDLAGDGQARVLVDGGRAAPALIETALDDSPLLAALLGR